VTSSTPRRPASAVAATLTKVLQDPSGLVPSPLPPPSPEPDVDPGASDAGLTVPEFGATATSAAQPSEAEPPLAWSGDETSHVGRPRTDEDADVADELALLAEPPGRLFDSDGPPTSEVPVISADDDLVRGFFESEPFTDDRWRGRRPD
jgi:hypothetical protein